MNFIDRTCSNPFIHNGDAALSILPTETVSVPMRDADTATSPPRLDAEGFCRVHRPMDLTGLEASKEAADRYRKALIPTLKAISGADEVVMFPNSIVRRQDRALALDRRNAADFVHTDITENGARDLERYYYPAPLAPGVRRIAHLNAWRLLSTAPTNLPLALCDARTVNLEDVFEGFAYFPAIDKSIGTGFLHASEHFRWLYYPNLTKDDLLIFKQFDSDPDEPNMVPHSAFIDPTCPLDAEPRVSIEARCIARWYD